MNVARKFQVGNLAGPCQRTPEFNFPAVGSESLPVTAHRLRGACQRQRSVTLPSGGKLSGLRRCNNSCGSRTTVADIWGSWREHHQDGCMVDCTVGRPHQDRNQSRHAEIPNRAGLALVSQTPARALVQQRAGRGIHRAIPSGNPGATRSATGARRPSAHRWRPYPRALLL